MKSCIVYKCIKPEGSDAFAHLQMDENRLHPKRLSEGRDGEAVTAPHGLAGDLELHCRKQAP